MSDPANDMVAQPSSPTVSSLSSSDLDTESTGSFFHDRSTTLGTLMGVRATPQAIAFRASSRQENPASAANGVRRATRPRRSRAEAARQRRRWWWSLCRDNCDAGRASLGQYLEVERRFGGGGPVTELEEGLVRDAPGTGRALFADGRVLPPAEVVGESSPAVAATGLCRFSAMERWCSLV